MGITKPIVLGLILVGLTIRCQPPDKLESRFNTFLKQFPESGLPYKYDAKTNVSFHEEISYTITGDKIIKNQFTRLDTADFSFILDVLAPKRVEVRNYAVCRFPSNEKFTIIIVNQATDCIERDCEEFGWSNQQILITYDGKGTIIDSLVIGQALTDRFIQFWTVSKEFEIETFRYEFTALNPSNRTNSNLIVTRYRIAKGKILKISSEMQRVTYD